MVYKARTKKKKKKTWDTYFIAVSRAAEFSSYFRKDVRFSWKKAFHCLIFLISGFFINKASTNSGRKPLGYIFISRDKTWKLFELVSVTLCTFQRELTKSERKYFTRPTTTSRETVTALSLVKMRTGTFWRFPLYPVCMMRGFRFFFSFLYVYI